MRMIKRPNIFSKFRWAACLATTVAFGVPAVAGELPELDCVLEPSNLIEISSAVEGVIENIYVDRNDAVTKNQLLVELDSEVERSQVALASARAASNTNILLRETASEFEQRKKTRIEALYDTNAVPLHLKDESMTDARKSQLELKKAVEDKQLAELELARAKAILRLRSMRSPIDGVVIARHKVPGEFVEDQAILIIAQLDPLFVELIAPVELFGSIAPGMRVEVSPEIAGFGRQFATVTMVDRVIHAASGTFDVRAELPNPDNRIPSGLRCTSRFIFETPDIDAIAEADTEQDEETAALELDSKQALKLARSEAPQSRSDPLDEL
ncbi:MAG: efflux RND transporter periplasmic adaptor subunit [Gammaproteobacteria bacterium]|nr:efflux RND transporter periplasmic adaptor subunit [Gammaproteobacteria bacterium]